MQAKLQRHPTPYSKDLKMKAKKLRNIDGRRSPDGSKRSSTGSLVPSESAPTPPVSRADDDEDKPDKPVSAISLAACCMHYLMQPVKNQVEIFSYF